ncbi:isochorismatase family cysteine hydrolase [Thermosipho atlanticus]|uniref:Nicotinamidase/pyrazinamidase n=1 Tax=Thermosipho atlanticus DSM 15807 TaxID=1123380 RepID=A0A1M5S3R9_9BACT|nr:isochorismatase family cysteine hydrolase [Thermosipho atlanticus]SHH33282.1 nicotinamidase/pyrazinamidase [Thermosipho atlanticus DSM 15807]
MKSLVIIDLQNDFAKKGGALYFNGAEKVIPRVLELIKIYKNQNYPIIFTQDWHDENDLEFNIWPKHCVKNTEGAEIVNEVKELILGYKNTYFIKKTRYSAFYKTNLDEIIKKHNINEVDIVGLVTNICVLFTVEEFRNRDIVVNVYRDGTTTYDENMYNYSIKLMKEVLNANII